MQSTRREILEYVQRQGHATVKELGQVLGLTSTGVRQHLTVLERDGLIRTHEERGRVGRPALVFTLTEKARALFPKHYDTLAVMLLDEVVNTAGNQHVHQMLRGIANRLADANEERVAGKCLGERVDTVVSILREQGCLAEFEQQGDEFFIHEYTCPYSNVVSKHHAVCTVDVEFVRRLTGGDVRLVRSLLRGEVSCSYRIRSLSDAEKTNGATEVAVEAKAVSLTPA